MHYSVGMFNKRQSHVCVEQTSLECLDTANNMARLFKTNDVVNQRFVKISNLNVLDLPIFFVKKM